MVFLQVKEHRHISNGLHPGFSKCSPGPASSSLGNALEMGSQISNATETLTWGIRCSDNCLAFIN